MSAQVIAHSCSLSEIGTDSKIPRNESNGSLDEYMLPKSSLKRSLSITEGVDFEAEIEHIQISKNVAENLESSRKKFRKNPVNDADADEIFAIFVADMVAPEEKVVPTTETFDATALSSFLVESQDSKEFWANLFVMEQER